MKNIFIKNLTWVNVFFSFLALMLGFVAYVMLCDTTTNCLNKDFTAPLPILLLIGFLWFIWPGLQQNIRFLRQGLYISDEGPSPSSYSRKAFALLAFIVLYNRRNRKKGLMLYYSYKISI